jgi:signal recognition particle subunit SRP54
MFEVLQENLKKAFSIFSKHGKLTPEVVSTVLKDVKRALLSADVNYKAVSEIIKNIQEKALQEKVLETLTPEQTVIKIVKDEIVSFLGEAPYEPEYAKLKRPIKIMLVGLQG